jgi:hypothetical protein
MVEEISRTQKKHKSVWYLEIYIQSYCVMINLTNFKHDAQNEIGLDISISKLNFVKLICPISILSN